MAIIGYHNDSSGILDSAPSPYANLVIVCLVVYIIFCIFVLVILLHDRQLWTTSIHLITANVMIAHLFGGFFVHPIEIRVILLRNLISENSCWLNQYASLAYLSVVPSTMLVYTFERMLYIQNPVIHKSRMTKYANLLMVGLPWLGAIIFAIAVIQGYSHQIMVGVQGPSLNSTFATCDLIIEFEELSKDKMIITVFICGFLPGFANFVLMLTILIVWCCYKEHVTMGASYIELGDDVRADVRDSIISIVILSFIGLAAFIVNLMFADVLLLDSAMLSLFGLVQGLVWLGTIRVTRVKVVYLLKSVCGLRKAGPRGSIHYEAADEDNIAIHT